MNQPDRVFMRETFDGGGILSIEKSSESDTEYIKKSLVEQLIDARCHSQDCPYKKTIDGYTTGKKNDDSN